jgi:hypothetical protein
MNNKIIVSPIQNQVTMHSGNKPVYNVMEGYSGMIKPGNIDVANRPAVLFPNGVTSTVRSINFDIDDKGTQVLVPSIGPNGEDWTNKQAMEHYRQTGENLGYFKDPDAAEKYAIALHNQQDNQYVSGGDNLRKDNKKITLMDIQPVNLDAAIAAQSKSTIPTTTQVSSGYTPNTTGTPFTTDNNGNITYVNPNNPNLSTGTQPITNGSTYFPEMQNYNQGLAQAKAKDSTGALSAGFNQRIYNILHPQPTPNTLPVYQGNAAFQRQTQDLGDGSTLMNPSDPSMNHQWNIDKLKQLYPSFSDADLQGFMNQKFNWQSYNALVNEGAIVPTQASQDYTNAQNQPVNSSNPVSYGNSLPSYVSENSKPTSSGNTPVEENVSDNPQETEPVDTSNGYSISAPSGTERDVNSQTIPEIYQDRVNYWKNLFNSSY